MWGMIMIKTSIQECLDEYYKVLSVKAIDTQLGILSNIIKNEFGFDYPTKNITDREKLEIIQEMYSLIYCFVKGLDYISFDVKGHSEDKYFNWIAEYKMEHFSKEIFQELGFEIVEKTNKNIKIRDVIPKQKLN